METRGALRSSPLPERPLGGASSRRGRPARSGRPGRARRWGGRGGVRGERRGPRPRAPARAAVCGWVPRRYRAVLPRAPWGRGSSPWPLAPPPSRLPVLPAAPRGGGGAGEGGSGGGVGGGSGRLWWRPRVRSPLGRPVRPPSVRPFPPPPSRALRGAVRPAGRGGPAVSPGGRLRARPPPVRARASGRVSGLGLSVGGGRPPLPPGVARLGVRPQIRRGDPLNLSILVSGGKETNEDSLSNGE